MSKVLPFQQQKDTRVAIFYDSLCPACRIEVQWLKRLDRQNLVVFIDITDPSFDPSQYGRTLEQFIGSIHGRNRQGEIIHGMPVFREVYAVLGWGWLYGWTSLPLIRPLIDGLYAIFARIRPKFSGFDSECQNSRCQIPKSSPGKENELPET